MPTNLTLRTMCECAQIQILETLRMPTDPHSLNIYEQLNTLNYGAFCECP